MPYINRRDGRTVETVDSFDSHKEARAMVAAGKPASGLMTGGASFPKSPNCGA